MSIWTLAELDTQIAAFKTALIKVASGQSYQMGDTHFTNADLPSIQKTLEYLNREKLALSRAGGPRVVPGRVRR